VRGRLDWYQIAGRFEAHVGTHEVCDVRQFLFDNVGIQMRQIEVDEVLAIDSVTGAHLEMNAATDHIPRRQINQCRSITLHEGSAQAVWRTLQEAHRAGGPDIDWIPQLGISRHCDIAAIEQWAVPLLELGVFRTLDLSGDEEAQPIEVFRPIYRKAQTAGLRLKAHVGEWGTADDVWRAVELLELDEVQHGIAASSSPLVMRDLANAGVRLNLCPTSNVKLGRVNSLQEHPIRVLFDAGVMVTINTDDPLIFGCTLSGEFQALYEAGVMTAQELDSIRAAAFD
jgi:adenosine deaminase